MKLKRNNISFKWLLIIVGLMFGLTACQSNTSEPTETAVPPTPTSPIVIEGAWSRTTPEVMEGSGIVYMIIHNNSDTPEKLVAAKSDVSEVAELHTHTNDNGVMRMRPVPEGYIEIPAHGSVELASGGLHVMLINLSEPLKAGETFPLSLKFENFGEIEIAVPVTEYEPETADVMPMEVVEEEVAEVEATVEPTPEPTAVVEEAVEEVAEETTEAEEDASPNIAPTPRAPADVEQGLFINLTTDNIDRMAMAIGFATKVLNNTDKPVTIFMNTQGARLADTNIPPNVHKSGMTSHEMLQKFMDDGGVALVCPVCMVNVGGMIEADVLDGVIIGTPEYTWSAMFAENVTVLSY